MLPISIGLSQCLLGDSVRYDGKNKYSKTCANVLTKSFTLHPICPEVEAGFSIPRPPVELVQHTGDIRVIGRDDKQHDVTDQLSDYCNTKVLSLGFLSGYVFTPHSPSCGFQSTPVTSIDGKITSYSSGVFAHALCNKYPQLPVLEEPALSDPLVLLRFQLQVISYYLINHSHVSQSCFDSILEDKTFSFVVQNTMSIADKMSAVNELFSKMNIQHLNKQLMALRTVVNDRQQITY